MEHDLDRNSNTILVGRLLLALKTKQTFSPDFHFINMPLIYGSLWGSNNDSTSLLLSSQKSQSKIFQLQKWRSSFLAQVLHSTSQHHLNWEEFLDKSPGT